LNAFADILNFMLLPQFKQEYAVMAMLITPFFLEDRG